MTLSPNMLLDKSDLSNVGFIVVGKDGYRNALSITSKKQYDSLISFAREKRYFVYYGKLVNKQIVLPYILDEASLKHKPEKVFEPPVLVEKKEATKLPDKLRCPHCKKECSSNSGLTLHVKNCKKSK